MKSLVLNFPTIFFSTEHNFVIVIYRSINMQVSSKNLNILLKQNIPKKNNLKIILNQADGKRTQFSISRKQILFFFNLMHLIFLNYIKL